MLKILLRLGVFRQFDVNEYSAISTFIIQLHLVEYK